MMQPSTELERTLAEYYSTQSAITDPRGYGHLFENLPRDVRKISDALQNVLLHHAKARALGLQFSPERLSETSIRPVHRLLSRIHQLDDDTWDKERSMTARAIVDCRHFATLLCAILRHRGIPARTRHGFASYLEPSHRQSHVVCQFWSTADGRWVVVDAETGLYDLAVDSFMPAHTAWLHNSAGELDASSFGYGADLRGAWCLRWEFIRDFAAINRNEMLTCDVWGINLDYAYNQALQSQDALLLDHLAALVANERQSFFTMRDLYEMDARVRVPPVIRSDSYVTGESKWVDLEAEGSLPISGKA